MITREVEVNLLHMTAMIVGALQAHTLATLPLGHAITIDDMMTTTTVTIGDEAEVALLSTVDDVTMSPTESGHGPVQTNPTIMTISGEEVLSIVESAQMKTRNGDIVLVLQNTGLTRSARATALLHVILVLTSRSRHTILTLRTALQNWPPCSQVPRLWRWNGRSG